MKHLHSTPKGLTRAQIKEKLHAKGFTFQMLAIELGCHANVLTAVASRKGVSHRAASAISLALGKTLTEVFPDVDSYKKSPLPKNGDKAQKQAELRTLLAS